MTQVIGNQTGPDGIHRSLFGPGDTLASRIANVFQGATTKVQTSTLFYLALILRSSQHQAKTAPLYT